MREFGVPFFAILSTLGHHDSAPPEIKIQVERQYDYGDRNEQIANVWRALKPKADLAAQFFDFQPLKPSTWRRPATKSQHFLEYEFIAAAEFFRTAAADVALRRANARRIADTLGSDAGLWIDRLSRQPAGRWNAEQRQLFRQAEQGLRFVLNVSQAIDPESIEPISCTYTVRKAGDHSEIDVVLKNLNDCDLAIPALLLLVCGAGRIGQLVWPKQAKIPRLSRIKAKFKVAFVAASIEVQFAPPANLAVSH